MKEVFIASDHAGHALRKSLIPLIVDLGAVVHDLGPEDEAGSHEARRVDYPDYAAELARNMRAIGDAFGVLVCGSGIGMCIAANRFPWIRAGLCYDVTTAKLARQHNNANVITLGSRLIGDVVAFEAVSAFLTTEFDGGRHQPRVEKLAKMILGE